MIFDPNEEFVGIRETINQKPRVAAVIAGAIVCLCLGVCLSLLLRGRPNVTIAAPLAFYSDDDGKTWFIDDLTKVTPFDHEGRQAVHAEVFRCNGGAPFVGFLERCSDASRAKIARLDIQDSKARWMTVSADPMDVKKPGQTKWVSSPMFAGSPEEYHLIVTPVCREGETGDPLAVPLPIPTMGPCPDDRASLFTAQGS